MDKEKIRKMLIEILQIQFAGLDLGSPWLQQIESINVVALIIVLEKNFSIEVQAAEMNERNFLDLETVTAWLENKIKYHATL